MSSRPTVLIPREPREQFEDINRFMNWAHNASPSLIGAFPPSYRRDCSGIFVGDHSRKLFGQWSFDDKDEADTFLNKNMRYVFGDKPFDIFGKGIFASDRISVRLNAHDEPVPVDAFYVSLESIGQMHALIKKHQPLEQKFQVIESCLSQSAPGLIAESPLYYSPVPHKGHLYVWLEADEEKTPRNEVSAVMKRVLGVAPQHQRELQGKYGTNIRGMGYKDEEIDQVVNGLRGAPFSPLPPARKELAIFKGVVMPDKKRER